MKNILSVLSLLLLCLLSACNSKETEALRQQQLQDKTYTVTSYNYTPYNLYGIAFKAATLPFNIDDAPSGGSVFFDNASKFQLDGGEQVSYSPSNCCLIWDQPLSKPLQIRVVWNVVYDMAAFENQTGAGYDERTSSASAPGSRWCQAVVEILPYTGSGRANIVFLHFLADGVVKAQFGPFGTVPPLQREVRRQHLAGLPQGQFCKQEIENPWHGIPRKPHRE